MTTHEQHGGHGWTLAVWAPRQPAFDLVDRRARALGQLMGDRGAATGVMLVQIVLQSVPTSTHSHHHVITQDPNKYECAGVPHPVFALRHFEHGKLCGAGAAAYEVLDHLIQVLSVGGAPLGFGQWRGLFQGQLQLLSDLLLYLLLQLDQHRGSHSETRGPPGYFQQTQHKVLLILPQH